MKESDIRNKDKFEEYLKLVREDTQAFFKDKRGFEDVPCVACGSKDYKEAFEKWGFKYVLCEDCGTLYANPRPSREELMAFYIGSRSAIFWINEFFLPMIESRREKIFKPRAELIAARIPVKTTGLLGDIGAGFGLFLEELRILIPGFKFVAIEPSAMMAGICRQKGFEAVEKAIEDIEDKERFDFLSAFELLEHLYDPRVLFKKACRMLKQGGFFLLTSLNCEGFDIRVLWDKSRNIYPPHHINFFNTRSLKRSLEEDGFCVEELTTPGKLDLNIVENAARDGLLGEERFWRTFLDNAKGPAKDEFQRFLAENGFSSHMMALARKR